MPCTFCQIARRQSPASTFYEDELVLGFMDIYPWRPFHALVIPKRHTVRVAELRDAERNAIFALGSRVAEALRASARDCTDVHFLINDGQAANQSVPHVHLHVLPRRSKWDVHKLLVALAKRPLVPLLRPGSRSALDQQATRIREQLSG